MVITRRASLDVTDGVNSFVFNLAKGFKKLGARVILVHHHFSKDPDSWFRVNEVARLGIELITIGKRSSSLARILWDWFSKGSRIINDLDPDAIIINGIVLLRVKRPKIAVIHGPLEEWKPSLVKRTAYRTLVKLFSDYRVAVSNHSKNDAERLGVVVDTIIPIALDVTEYEPLPLAVRENIVLHVGTAPRKQAEISILAIKKCAEMGVDVRLVLIGPRNDYVERLVKRYRGYSWFEYVGEIDDKTLHDYYSRARALILPSKAEGLPYVALEAQASGTPVVVSKAVPPEAVIHGLTGFRLDTFDPNVYAMHIYEVLTDEALWQRMSFAARKHAEKFHITEIAQLYVDLIKRLRGT